MSPTEKSPKISAKFYCEICDYKCFKQSEYNKHILTSKHQILQNPTSNPTSKISKIWSIRFKLFIQFII